MLAFYHDKTPMLPLLESPGLRIINPTKAGDGYWNYEKMAYQTEDVIDALGVLDPLCQQLHQFHWSSRHKKGKENGLDINAMNFHYGGSGGHHLRDTELTDGCVGDGDAFVYETIIVDQEDGISRSIWSMQKPTTGEAIVHDCRVRVGDT